VTIYNHPVFIDVIYSHTPKFLIRLGSHVFRYLIFRPSVIFW